MAISCFLSVVDLRETPDVSRRISDVAELCGPRSDGFKRLGLEAVITMATLSARCDEAAAAQDGQVPRKGRLGHFEWGAELRDGQFRFVQALQNGAAGGIGDGPEDAIVR
jgi:hypothetical protein